MARAIELAAKAGLGERSGGCFGAVIVNKDGEIVGEGYNQVLSKHDPTSHAEINAIRRAARYMGTHVLDNCVLYASGEPCPMCRCAAAWARIPKIIYGSTVADARFYGNFDDEQFQKLDANSQYLHCEHDPDARLALLELWQLYKQSNPQHY